MVKVWEIFPRSLPKSRVSLCLKVPTVKETGLAEKMSRDIQAWSPYRERVYGLGRPETNYYTPYTAGTNIHTPSSPCPAYNRYPPIHTTVPQVGPPTATPSRQTVNYSAIVDWWEGLTPPSGSRGQHCAGRAVFWIEWQEKMPSFPGWGSRDIQWGSGITIRGNMSCQNDAINTVFLPQLFVCQLWYC